MKIELNMKQFFPNLKVIELAGVLAVPSVSFFLVIIFSLTGCSKHNAAVLFLSKSKNEFSSIGIVPLNKKLDYYDTLFPWVRKNYDSIADIEFRKETRFISVNIPNEIDYVNPDKDDIKEICRQKKLDGVLISKIDFTKHVLYYHPGSPYAIPLKTYYDHILESKVFDKEGNMLYNVISATNQNKMVRRFKNEAAFHVSVASSIELIHKLRRSK